MPKSKNDQPIALDRAHLGSRLDRSRGQSSVLESWRSLGSPQLPGPSFPAYESPPTANRRVHWWGFTTLQDGSRRILPPVRLGEGPIFKCIDCVICLTNISNVLFCDCGHICICSECDILKCLDACPICRAKSTIKWIIE